MPIINFKLRHPDEVTPWGINMHWFGLTDSNYWLQLGAVRIFEYTGEVLKHWDIQDHTTVDYHVIRLIEDLTNIFDSLVEPVPDELYEIAKNQKSLYDFYVKATQWLDQLSDDPSIDSDTYYDKYDKLIEWVYSRSFTSMHLNHGPVISFFRNRDKLSIVWEADHVTDEDIPVWTAQTGELEMKYEDFVNEVEDFGKRFFLAMESQVKIAVEKDWGKVELNKTRLVEEHGERKIKFQHSVTLLKSLPTKTTDWDLVRSLIKEMNAQQGDEALVAEELQ